jgi:hypothetical protein
MSTVGNAHTGTLGGVTAGNPFTKERFELYQETNPTLSNGDGTYSVTMTSIRLIDSTDDVNVKWSGIQKADVVNVDGNTVTVLVESADGADSYAPESDGELTGQLTVQVKA